MVVNDVFQLHQLINTSILHAASTPRTKLYNLQEHVYYLHAQPLADRSLNAVLQTQRSIGGLIDAY